MFDVSPPVYDEPPPPPCLSPLAPSPPYKPPPPAPALTDALIPTFEPPSKNLPSALPEP